MPNPTIKEFTVVYVLPNEKGDLVSKTEIIKDVISDLLYEGPFILFRRKDDSTRRFHQNNCIDISEIVFQREAVIPPSI